MMKLLRYLALIQLATTLSLGQAAHQRESASPPGEAEALVRRVYKQALALHPIGIPTGPEMNLFSPYLSKALLRKIDLFLACYADWSRQNPDPKLKPPFGVLESGIFSGDDDHSSPQAFDIAGVRLEKDGSFHVTVRLTYQEPPSSPWIWRVAAIVVREKGRLVVNDVVYLKDSPREVESRLTSALAYGCNTTHWIGYGARKKG
jgi:hypothetical protein